MKKYCMLLSIIVLMTVITACGTSSEDDARNNMNENLAEEQDDMSLEADINSEDQIQEEESEEESEEETEEETEEVIQGEGGIDVDLTVLSATMVYAEVYNMYMNPDDYIGKSVKMEGSFFVLNIEQTGMIYFSVIIEDALGCCAQGIEFELAGDYEYPDDYPEVGEEVIVVGEFETYYEDGALYCRLQNAEFR